MSGASKAQAVSSLLSLMALQQPSGTPVSVARGKGAITRLDSDATSTRRLEYTQCRPWPLPRSECIEDPGAKSLSGGAAGQGLQSDTLTLLLETTPPGWSCSWCAGIGSARPKRGQSYIWDRRRMPVQLERKFVRTPCLVTKRQRAAIG